MGLVHAVEAAEVLVHLLELLTGGKAHVLVVGEAREGFADLRVGVGQAVHLLRGGAEGASVLAGGGGGVGHFAELHGLIPKVAHAVAQSGEDSVVDTSVLEHVVQLVDRLLWRGLSVLDGELRIDEFPLRIRVRLLERGHQEDEGLSAESDDEHLRGTFPVFNLEQGADDHDRGSDAVQFGHT